MKKGFTLIEILVVVLIIVVLAITVLLILNPITLSEQAYDATRVSDMNTLNKAISLYYSDAMSNPSTLFMGTSSIVYVSIPDPAATSTNACPSLNLPALPAGYTYQCASKSTYTNVNGTGWIPINFNSYLSGKAGSIISKLPVDPVNQTSSGLYYTYSTDGESNYEITSIFQSTKYKAQYATNVLDPDYPEVDAKGSSLSLSPLYNPSGLVGWWPLTEGSGTTAYDQSGNGNNGTWQGTMPYYAGGKVGTYAGNFNGSNSAVSTPVNNFPLGSNPLSIFAWIYPTSYSSLGTIYVYGTWASGNVINFDLNSGGVLSVNDIAAGAACGPMLTLNTWHFIGYTNSSGAGTMYVDGSSSSCNIGGSLNITSGSGSIGATLLTYAYFFPGLIDDVRVYNRVLSPAEVQALYDAEK